MNEKPVLMIREGQLVGQKWTVEDEDFYIGRGHDCQIVLPERQVSRQHVMIRKENGHYILHDLGSKNGTYLNGRQIEGTTQLHDGDEISIALCVKLVFVGTEATIPLNFDPPQKTGSLEIDVSQRAVLIHNQELTPPLSLAQFRLLQLLFQKDGAVCSRDQIVNVVWPGTDGLGVSEQAIDALVRRLRDRLAELDAYNFIVTVRGHGFRLDNEPH